MAVDIIFSSPSAKDHAVDHLRADKPLKIRIDWGKYAGSTGLIHSRYIVWPGWRGDDWTGSQYSRMGFKEHTKILLKDGRVVKLDGVNAYKTLLGLSPRAPMVLVEAAKVVHPEFILDRHGQELRIGTTVLISQSYNFAFGRVEKLTRDWVVIRRGKQRTKLANRPGTAKALVKLDRGIADRFMLEKLSKM